MRICLLSVLGVLVTQAEGGRGEYREYLNTQAEVLSQLSGSCEYKRFMLKYDQGCIQNNTKQREVNTELRAKKVPQSKQCVQPLFITGAGGSGTHFVSAFLGHMKRLGKVTHEEPHSSASVVVSWASRHGPALLGKNWGKYQNWGAQQKNLREPMVKWAAKQSLSTCTYRKVAHVVRHPLKVLSSSIAFGQCVECWVHIEEFVLPSFRSFNGTDLTRGIRTSIYANRASKKKSWGGREWSEQSQHEIIKGFGLYWLAWNKMIEPIADYRFQVEVANYIKLCELAGVNTDTCKQAEAAAHLTSHKFQTGNHGGSPSPQSLRITWNILSGIDTELSNEMWSLASRYGYDREPPHVLPRPAVNAIAQTRAVPKGKP